MDNDNSNNDLITISGESMTLHDINTNLDTLTNNIFSMLNRETRPFPLFPSQNNTNLSGTNNIFQNLFQDPFYLNTSLPTLGGRSNLNSIIQQSFIDKNKYKNILSDEGENMIKFERFDQEKHKTICCPILQAPFQKNDKIAILPCNHIFDKESIIEWLTTENALCPVCRYKLPSKEVKIEDEVTEVIEENSSEDTSEDELLSHVTWVNNPLVTPTDISNNDISSNDMSSNDISNNIDNLWNNYLTSFDDNAASRLFNNPSYRNIRNRYISRRPRIENRIYRSVLTNLIRSNEEAEEREIQQAILASLEEQDKTNNDT